MKKITKKLEEKLFTILDITSEDIIWSEKKTSQKGDEYSKYILKGFVKDNNHVLTMVIVFTAQGKLFVSLNEKQGDKFVKVKEVTDLNEVISLINSRRDFESLDTGIDLSKELAK